MGVLPRPFQKLRELEPEKDRGADTDRRRDGVRSLCENRQLRPNLQLPLSQSRHTGVLLFPPVVRRGEYPSLELLRLPGERLLRSLPKDALLVLRLLWNRPVDAGRW